MKTITQTVNFEAPVHDVYELIMDSKKHSTITGHKAVISRKKGGKFTAYGDYIKGKNLELVKDKRIVQTWRASDWPKGVDSKVTFLFEKSKDGTKLIFTHEDVPDDQYSDLKKGWIDFYWQPMKKFLMK